MPNYRIYLLDQDDRIFKAGTLIAVTDADARSRVGSLPEIASAIEVWQGTRCIWRTASDPLHAARPDIPADARDADTATWLNATNRGRRVWDERGDGGGYV
jgi:hypothetical protein